MTNEVGDGHKQNRKLTSLWRVLGYTCMALATALSGYFLVTSTIDLAKLGLLHDLKWPSVWFLLIAGEFVGLTLSYRSTSVETGILLEKRKSIESQSEKEPRNSRLAWDLARITLEQYFNRNLNQTRLIFLLACGAMGGGCFLLVWAVIYGIQSQKSNVAVLVGGASGVITQFIGATFMVLYRSTIQQASEYVAVLERINTVGMAVQILESVPETDPLSAQTRAEMARLLLLSTNRTTTRAEIRKRRTPNKQSNL